MDENPITETRAAAGKAMPETVREPGLPEKSFSTETEPGQKAKPGAEVPVLCVVWHRIYRMDVLEAAWGAGARANKGAPGVDGLTIEQIVGSGPRCGGIPGRHSGIATHEDPPAPQAVQRIVYIPKANGKLRPLGIP